MISGPRPHRLEEPRWALGHGPTDTSGDVSCARFTLCGCSTMYVAPPSHSRQVGEWALSPVSERMGPGRLGLLVPKGGWGGGWQLIGGVRHGRGRRAAASVSCSCQPPTPRANISRFCGGLEGRMVALL